MSLEASQMDGPTPACVGAIPSLQSGPLHGAEKGVVGQVPQMWTCTEGPQPRDHNALRDCSALQALQACLKQLL
eukprot:10167565-Alexandrium_andersonii.AAC.1